jgi:hypothetical protein
MTPTAAPPRAFEKKWIYNKEVKATDNFVAMITGPQKFAAQSGNPYFPIRYQADGESYMYFPENDAQTQALTTALQNTWYRWDATGWKEDATLGLFPVDGGAPVTQTPKPTYEPAPTDEFYGYDSVFDAYMACLAAADDVQAWFKNAFEREMTELDHKVAISMLIQQKDSGYRMPLTSMQGPASLGTEIANDATEAQINDIHGLMDRKVLSDEQREAAEKCILDGLTKDLAQQWIDRLEQLPDKPKDDLPF